MQMNGLRLFFAVSAVAVCLGCQGQQEPAPSAPPANAKRVDESKAGTVVGRVTIEGAVPANPPIDLAADPYCASQNSSGATFENFVVSAGGLDNVFVYVKDGLGDYGFDVPTEPVKLDQLGCQYRPHVLGVRVGQKLVIGNSDDTLHNVHAMGKSNGEWNKGQALKNMSDTKVFKTREVMIPFKCDVHNWMRAYVGVMEHPYFAVTHDGGTFELKNLPAGTYAVEAWHETLGTQTQTVTLGDKESKQLTFTFKAPAAGTN
jgi:plastocyanin